MPFHQSTMI